MGRWSDFADLWNRSVSCLYVGACSSYIRTYVRNCKSSFCTPCFFATPSFTMAKACSFSCPTWLVASNGLDEKAFALPCIIVENRKFLTLAFDNKEFALFFTGANKSRRPLAHCSLKSCIQSAIRDGVNVALAGGAGDYEDMDGGPAQEDPSPPMTWRRMRRWRRAAEKCTTMVDVPKFPGSDVTRPMTVSSINGVDKVYVLATAENLNWLLGYVRHELGLAQEPARKVRRQ